MTTRIRRIARPAGLAVALWLALAAGAEAGIPTDQIRQSTDRVLALVQDPALRATDRAAERRQQLRTVADQIFDWKETGKRALGRHWQPLKPAQQEEFATLFADLVERSYIGKIEAYSGERILYVGEAIESSQATVRTRLVTKSQTEVPIDYRLQKEGDRWRVYDVSIEGVSLVANYRSQFNRIITQSGFDSLLQKMKTKKDELSFEEGGPPRKSP